MRIVSIVIALLVTIALYFFVFERDRLTNFAASDTPPSGETPDTTAQTESEFATPAQKTMGEAHPVSVVVRHSTAQLLANVVVVRGETEAAREVNVTAETSGRVVNAPLRKGAYVQADQTLCELDIGTREAILAQAKAEFTQAEVALANARKLAEGGYASETQILTAEAGIESARAAVALASRDIENLTIKAPFAGLLESDTAELGTFLSSGSACATVIQLDPIKLVGYAPEADVAAIEVGALAGARLISGPEVTGRVTFLSRSADPSTRTFRVEVEIPNPDFSIRDGQTVEMAISAAGLAAHLVPQSALTLDDEGQIGLRLLGADSRAEFAPVQVLRDTREGIWVAGLADEVDIIVVGQDFVKAGVMVAASFEEAPTATDTETQMETPMETPMESDQ